MAEFIQKLLDNLNNHLGGVCYAMTVWFSWQYDSTISIIMTRTYRINAKFKGLTLLLVNKEMEEDKS